MELKNKTVHITPTQLVPVGARDTEITTGGRKYMLLSNYRRQNGLCERHIRGQGIQKCNERLI